MQNNHFLNHLLEKAKQDNISDNVKLLGLKFYDQVPQKNIKSHLYAPFLSKCIEQKGALGHRPSRQSVQSTSGEEYNEARAHNRILNLTFEMRKQKKFLTPLALEALTEQLSNKKSCLLTLGRRNHTITKFETFEKMLNILLDVAQVDFSHDDEEDVIENLPIAKRFVYVLMREAEFKTQDSSQSLALPLDPKLYRSIIQQKPAQAETLNAQQIYKKRKLNAANGQGNGNGNGSGGVPFKPYNFNKSKQEKNNMFDLAKGRYFEEDLTFLNFQRSGVISMEREFTQYEKENFVLNHSFKEEVTKFLNNEQNKSKENNITVFKMENSTSFKNPHSLAMGTFQHVQPNMQHPFGLNLAIPPLPKFEPGKPLNTAGIGIGAFSLNNNNTNNKSSFNIDMGTSLTFTLPQDDSQQNLPTISGILAQEKLKSNSRPRRNRFEDSIFANGSMLPEILKEKGPEQFDVSNLWEDYGLSKNDNRFKDLNIAPCGLITKEKCRDFKLRVEKAHENIIGDTYQEVDDEALIESISMLLMGLGGDLFMFDDQQIAFYSKRLPISLAHFTHQTLFGSLDGFVKAGTQFYRIQKLIDFFKQQGKGTLVTNIFYELLQDYTTHYSSSIICIKNETKEYLDFMVRSKKMLRELEIVYDITFCKAVREGIKLADLKRCIPKSGYLLNLMYNLLNSIELASMHVDLIQYIFQHTVKPLLGYIRNLIFKGLLVDEYKEFFLKYDTEKECYMLIEDSEEDVELPLFLRKVVPSVVECANNMLLFKTHDKGYYDVFKEENLEIDVKFENQDVQEYEIQAQERFDLKEKYLEKLSKDLKFSQEQRDYQQSQRRILYLQKIRKDIEAEAEENRKLLAQQREQRENLKQALADQIYHKQTLEKFNKEIEREAEKAQMLEKELNERKQLEKEKRRLLRELRAIQNETAIPEDDDYESDFGQPTIMEVEAENQENFDHLRPATVSTESPQKLTKASSEPEQSELTLRTPEASQKMMIEEDGFEGEEGSLKKKARRKWTKEKKEEPKEESKEVVENGNLLGSPPRIKGYRTPAKEGSAIVIRSLASDAKVSKNRWLQKKIEEKEQGDDWLTIVKERMPIDILVQICVANVIEEQTRLTNKAMVQILLEKHKLKSVLEYLKKSLFGENGDKADNYAETLFKENSTTDWQAIVNSNSYWDEKNSEEVDFKFFFELKTRATAFIPQNAENFDLTFYMDLGCEMPAIMKRLFTKEDLRSYLRIFTFVIKLRYLSLIVRKQWKTIAKDLMQIEEYQKFAKHAQLFRHRLQTFLSHYQEYVYTAVKFLKKLNELTLVQVVEGSFKKLSNKIAKAKSLDDLVKAHDNYLENILKKCFIDTYIRNVSESITKAVATVLRFNGIINNLANSEVNYIRLAEYKDELKQLETNFTQYQGFMSIVFEKVVERDQQYAFVSQNLF